MPLHKTQHMTSAQQMSHSTSALRNNTEKKQMRREKKGANYSLIAGWPETKLIIIIVKKAQRKPAASPLPPQSNREAFSLRNDLESDKSNRFTVTAWKGPARTLLLFTWPHPSTKPLLHVTGDSEEWSWLNRGRQQAYWVPPPLNTSALQTRGKKLCFEEVSYLKLQTAR